MTRPLARLPEPYDEADSANGSEPYRRWLSPAQSVALNRTIGWLSKHRILSLTGEILERYPHSNTALGGYVHDVPCNYSRNLGRLEGSENTGLLPTDVETITHPGLKYVTALGSPPRSARLRHTVPRGPAVNRSRDRGLVSGLHCDRGWPALLHRRRFGQSELLTARLRVPPAILLAKSR